ncbi:MAG: signal recognition particle-docking protein FtsY [Deltaproteobacteria bacterium]|nr:MAG: signal recognition particle-docking protein FtsY [Deltaproteobacteria bacterium]
MGQEERQGIFQRLRLGLSKTQRMLVGGVEDLLRSGRGLDEEVWEQLEEILIEADIGVVATKRLIEGLKSEVKKGELMDIKGILPLLQQKVLEILQPHEVPLPPDIGAEGPFVVMVVGVNGVGKTTTIGKLARRFTFQGKKVLVAAADTFRAAAIEQLEVWSRRAGAHLIRHRNGADPSAVAYDAAKASLARKCHLLFIDTAGRLHTKENLMEELKKVKRVIGKVLPCAPHEILLVLDATTGQNALVQARTFHQALGVTGIALTKLDGTARGGIVVAIAQEMDIPLRFVGVGEEIDDLQEFSAEGFVRALFSQTT